MDEYGTRRVFEKALDKLDSPKGWVILAGSVAGLYLLSKKDILNMDDYGKRRVLEKLIDKIG